MAEFTRPVAPTTAKEASPQPRRRRGNAFFNTGVDDPDSPTRTDKAAAQEKLSKATQMYPPGIVAILVVAVPFIFLMIYLFTPPPAPRQTTPLVPLLKSLTSLTNLSPALPFTGLATHMLLRTLNTTPNVSADLLKQAEDAKVAVELFSGEEDLFRSGTVEGLEQLLSLEEWTEEGMKQGYESFFVGKEAEAGRLAKRTEQLGATFVRLGSGLEGVGKEGEPGMIVDWLGLVVRRANGVFKDVEAEAKKARKNVEGFGRGWMGEELLKLEKRAIEKYTKAERKAGAVLDAISKDYVDGKMKNAVEEKLKKAIAGGHIDWW